jgi:hypothetical protein
MSDIRHNWHVGINKTVHGDGVGWEKARWMYTAKELDEESKRLPYLFMKERTGALRQTHHQCSRDAEGTPVSDNHLTCCLGVECRKCEFLAALDKNISDVPPEEMDKIKSWTCIAHILAQQDFVDTSEGMILTTDDRMFWDNVYRSMGGFDDEPEPES